MMESTLIFPRPGFVLAIFISTAHAWNYLFTGVGYNGPDQFENFITVGRTDDYTCYPAGLDMSLPQPDHLFIEVPTANARAPKYMGLYGRPFREISKLKTQDKYSYLNDPDYNGCQERNLFAVVAWYQGFPNLQELHFKFYGNQLSHLKAIDTNDPGSRYIAGLQDEYMLGQGDVISKNIITGDWMLDVGKVELMPLGVYPPRYRGGDNWVPSPDVIRAEDEFLQEGNGPSGYITDVEYKRGQDRIRKLYDNYQSPSPAYTRLKFGGGEEVTPNDNVEGSIIFEEDEEEESPVEHNFRLGSPQIRPAPAGGMEEEIEEVVQEQGNIQAGEMEEEKEDEDEIKYSMRDIMEMMDASTINKLSPKTKKKVFRQYDEHLAEFRQEIEDKLFQEAEEQEEQARGDQDLYHWNSLENSPENDGNKGN
ncbi:hypothetical protein TWF694_008986 [Orbilia ellipsospora]|uniref:Uncharacterized protein n=1 Tax=Orbilia ellipsospora TaxID=2528407 RepID=A0AAV9XEI4_9PEZI